MTNGKSAGTSGSGVVTSARTMDAVVNGTRVTKAITRQVFASPVPTCETASFPGKDGSPRKIDGQNELLTRYPGDYAGKTGYTDLARKTLVTAANRNGRRLLVVLM